MAESYDFTNQPVPHQKVPKPTANLIPPKTDDASPSQLPYSNDVLSTEEDSPLMQAVLKVPSVDPSKHVSNRKDTDVSIVGVDEMTANLHANDQPIYRVVTQPSAEKKSNKKTAVKEQTTERKSQKTSHKKKSTLKGR